LIAASARPSVSDAGRALLVDARQIVRDAEGLRAHAESIVSEVEPELSLAVDAVFPEQALRASLKALSHEFQHLPVTLFTEGLGGAEQRLRDHVARLGIYSPLPTGSSSDLIGEFLALNPMVPVVAADHLLTQEPSPLTREVIERHVQLVITDRTALTAGFQGNVLGRRIWRFADMSTRLEYVLDAFGWCYMPAHLVDAHITAGRLKRLDIAEHRGREFSFPLHVMHERSRPPGRAGRWLIAELRRQLRSLARNWHHLDCSSDCLIEQAAGLVILAMHRHYSNRATGGIGLGLTASLAIIRRHGGDIVLSNLPAGELVRSIGYAAADWFVDIVILIVVATSSSVKSKQDKISEWPKPRHDVDQHDKAGDYTQWSRNA
jgi:DNA-binding transcriptional LysR family regulator